MAMTVTGLFDTVADAQSAVQELLDNGWTQEQISLVTGQKTDEEDPAAHLALKDTEKGAVVGGLAGLLLGLSELAVPGVGPVLVGGWIVTTLLGAGVGAAAGGLVGALVQAGVPHEKAGSIAEGVRRGGTLVTIKSDEGRVNIAEQILRHHHVVDIEERAAQWRQES